jgi:hypothetical protein
MGTFSRSLALTKQSWSVLKANPSLALFPIISSVVSLLVLASFAVPVIVMFMSGHGNQIITGTQGHEQMQPVYYVISFFYYLVSYFVVIFFNAGLVSCASEIFAGRPATFNYGLQQAFKRIGSIFLYALIAATIGMILRMLSERAGIFGRIVYSLLGMAWTVLTYFVAPILVLEGKSPFTAIKESGVMLKNTWGERLVINAGTGLVFGLLGLLAFIPIAAAVALMVNGSIVLGIALIACAILYFVILMLISSTLTGVFQTALYLYARTGQLPTVYEPAMVQFAFRQKGAPRNNNLY